MSEKTRITTDEFGNPIPPTQSYLLPDNKSGWHEYDSSQGHCGLCGNLYCHGECFK